MNNEEKNPSVVEEAAEKNTAKATDTAKSGSWWTKLSSGVKIGIIAGLSCLVVAIVALVLILGGGKQPGGPQGDGGNGGNNGQVGTNATYSITVVTKGGMALTQLPIYIFEFEDGSLGDMVEDGGYAATDATGKASFNLPKDKQYAARIDLSLPKGYDAQSYYPIVSNDMTITVSSSVLPDTGLVGVTYNAGSVMQDFTVTTTEGTTFTLSEVLKEKKAVLINFWYTECSWCVTEFPLMQAAYEKYQDDLAIIALDPPSINQDTLIDVTNFKSSYGLTFDVAMDEIGLFSAFNVEGYPTSAIVDRYGVVTLLHAGAITSERVFDVIFDFFTKEDYQQQIVYDYNQIVPKEKPNVQMPTSNEISNVFDGGNLDIEYRPYPDDASDEEKEYSWPFVTDTVKIEGSDVEYDVIKTSNAFKEGSYAQMIFNVDLKAGDTLAFDYYSSTELGADKLYVVVNDKDIYAISGIGTGWETCYAFVAEEDGTYEVGLVYAKDSSDNAGLDTVYLKDLRIVTEDEIDSPTYIYRFAATNPDKYNNYQDYITPVPGTDGYYHVNSADGPILLADLMGYTRFADDNSIYYMAVDLGNLGKITAAEYNKIVEYCNYASNSTIYGVSPVTPELKDLLNKIVAYYGDSENANDWQRICCYYDAYGTDGKQLEDPIKGLATFSAYDVIVSETGSTDFPNSFTYNRVIMPRGLLAKFSPTVSGTYLIASNAYDPATDTYGECDAWIFTADSLGNREAWLTYESVDRMNTTDYNNCYIIAYFEAGRDYYIDIAYYDVYTTGTINYRVEYLGGEGVYRFSMASPGYFTALISPDGEFTETIAGGIEVVRGDDGIWREKRTDGREGSILYADFTKTTVIFSSNTLAQMIDLGGFNFGFDEYGESAVGKDYTEKAREIYSRVIKEGYNETLGEYIEAGDERIGCVIVTDDVVELLQKLMDKYTFPGVENSWRKLCYYHQYFCAATPK